MSSKKNKITTVNKALIETEMVKSSIGSSTSQKSESNGKKKLGLISSLYNNSTSLMKNDIKQEQLEITENYLYQKLIVYTAYFEK